MALSRIGVLAAAVTVLGAAIAFAASLTLDGRSLGMASVGTPRCTTAGIGVIQNLSGSNVISVSVSGLPAGCGSATLQVTVNNTAASSSGSAAVPAGGGAVTVTLGAAVAIAAIEEVDLVLTGP
jgi:hypothetical protein